MAIIAPTPAGEDAALVAAVGPDKYLNAGTERLFILNGSGAPITVTIDSQKPCNQGSDHNTPITVAAGQAVLCPPFSMSRYNDPTGYVNLTYSSPTTVTVGVFEAD